MPDYECWGDHATPAEKDLTEKVEEAIALHDTRGDVVVFTEKLASQPSRPPQQIVVTCKKGHENVFTIGEGAPRPPVRGTPPSPEQKIAFAAAANLVPEKSLARTQELAKFVFSSIGVVGTLLTGLGLFTDLGEVLDSSLKIDGIPLALLLVGLSLACAALALLPEMKRLDLARLGEVESWYKRQIRWRGRAVQFSLGLFVAAILAATLAGFGGEDASPGKPSISGSWTGLGEEAIVKVAVKTEDVPEDWVMVTAVYTHKDLAAEKRVFYDRTRPGADGEVAVAGEVQVPEDVKRVQATVRLYSGDENDEPEAESDLTLGRG